MSKLARIAMVSSVGIALAGAAVYSALPERISPVQATRNGDAETAVKIVGDAGSGLTRTFKLPPAPERHSETRPRSPACDLSQAPQRNASR